MLPASEALSGITGSVSLAAWFVLLLPQLYENYRSQSAEAVSLTFLLVWFAGDIVSFLGAVWAGLVPTVIALAVYFCFADLVLITQCLYYNFINRQRRRREPHQQHQQRRRHARRKSKTLSSSDPTLSIAEVEGDNDEERPLLQRNADSDTTSHDATLVDGYGSASAHRSGSGNANAMDGKMGKSGTQEPPRHRRRSSGASWKWRVSSLPVEEILGEPEGSGARVKSRAKSAVLHAIALFAVCALGTAGWAIAYAKGWWEPTPAGEGSKDSIRVAGAEVLGYASAVLYLGARLPQIWKNYQERSCDGLSLLFFMLSLLGNSSQGATILFHSLEREYVLKNLPWLLGSLGTIFEDVMIFIQFSLYSQSGHREESEPEATDTE